MPCAGAEEGRAPQFDWRGSSAGFSAAAAAQGRQLGRGQPDALALAELLACS